MGQKKETHMKVEIQILVDGKILGQKASPEDENHHIPIEQHIARLREYLMHREHWDGMAEYYHAHTKDGVYTPGE